MKRRDFFSWLATLFAGASTFSLWGKGETRPSFEKRPPLPAAPTSRYLTDPDTWYIVPTVPPTKFMRFIVIDRSGRVVSWP